VEEFIVGREATVLIFENPDNEEEPIILPPLEFILGSKENFKDFNLKNFNWE